MLKRKIHPIREQFERYAEENFISAYRTAMRLTRHTEEASDLTQEAILRAYKNFDKFDGKNFKAWLLKILTNIYINKYRKKEREAPITALEEIPNYMPASPEEEMPDRQLFDELLGSEVEDALEKVPEDFRIVIILCDIEQMSYEEIAQTLEIPIGTVRSRLARGRSTLRNELGQYAKKHGYL